MLKKLDLSNVLPFLVFLILALIFLFPLLSRAQNLGWEDWDQFSFFTEVPRDTLLRYYQFPLWNPYSTGGRPLFANPQVAIFSITFLVSLLFGSIIGLKIAAFIIVFVGMVGIFLLSKQYCMKQIPSILTAATFGLSGCFSLCIFAGHIPFFTWALIPYVFLFFLKSLQNRKHVVFAAIAFALIILDVGVARVLMPFSVFWGLFAILLSFQKKIVKPLTYFLLIYLLACGISAIRILPTVEYLFDHQRSTSDSEKVPFNMLPKMFLDADLHSKDDHIEGLPWRWHEYGAYLGILPLILFLIGLILFFTREYPLILSGLFMFVFSLGKFSKYAPWPILHKLPFMSSMHVPTRSLILSVFVIVIISGLAFDYFWKKVEKMPLLKYLMLLTAVLIVIDLLVVNRPPYESAFNNPIPNIDRCENFTSSEKDIKNSGALSSMFYNFLANRGTLNAYDNIPHKRYAKGIESKDYRGEVYLEDGGDVHYVYWSPNKLVVSVDAANQTRVIINQNYDRGWRVKGGKAEDFNGLLSAQVPKGVSEITFYYLPTSFLIGAIISLLTVSGIILVLWKKPKIKFSRKIKKLFCNLSSGLYKHHPF